MLILGVVKDVPVPKLLPPVDAANQFKVPELAMAAKVTVPASQRDAGVVEKTDGVLFTVATTTDREELHEFELASA